MATIEQLRKRRRAAFRAGDTVNADRYDAEIKSMDTGTPPQGSMQDVLREKTTLIQPDSRGRVATVQAGLFPFGKQIAAGAGAGVDAAKSGDFRNLSRDFGTRLDQKNADIAGYKESDPTGHTISSIGSSMLGGGAGMAAINPKNWWSATKAAALEGSLYGASDAPPGLENRLKGAGTGGVLGLAGGLAGTGIEKALGAIAPTGRGLKNLFTAGDPAMTDLDIEIDAWKHITNTAKRAGGVENVQGSYPKTATLADNIAGGEQLVGRAAGHSDEAAAIAEKSAINTRTGTQEGRLRTDLGADSSKLQGEFWGKLDANRSAAGDNLDKYIKSKHGDPLGNQEAVDDFLSLKLNSGLEKDIIKNLEMDGLTPLMVKKGKTDANGLLIPGQRDTNIPLYDEAFLQEMVATLGKKASKVKQEGGDWARVNKLKTQAKKLLEDLTPDDKLKDLRSAYKVTMQDQRAYTTGAKGLGAIDEGDIIKNMKGMSPRQLEALREGTITSLANKDTDLLSFLNNEGKLRKLSLIFGPEATTKFGKVFKKAAKERDVSDSLANAIAMQKQGIASDTWQGRLSAAVDVMGRLKNKRAYGKMGAIFMVANEVVDIMMRSDLPAPVAEKIMSILATSGDDVGKALTRIKDVEMPVLDQNAIFKAATSAANKTRMGAYAAGTASLTERLQGGEGGN